MGWEWGGAGWNLKVVLQILMLGQQSRMFPVGDTVMLGLPKFAMELLNRVNPV